jgi:HSP20 family protein
MLSITPWRKNLSTAAETRMLPVSSFRRELDHIVDRFFEGAWGDTDGFSGDPLRLDVQETSDEIVVRAEVAGVDPKNLDIQLAGDTLVISGEKRDELDQENGTLTYSERRYGSFRRALRLAAPVEPEKVRAEHANGVVTITLTKAESVRPRRIQVKSG